MLSRFDTFGMAALDAMAASLPVVLSGNVGAKDLVRDGENGFIVGDPADAAAVADRLAQLLSKARPGNGWGRKPSGPPADKAGTRWPEDRSRSTRSFWALFRNADSLEFGEPTKLKVNVEVFLHDAGFISATSTPSRGDNRAYNPFSDNDLITDSYCGALVVMFSSMQLSIIKPNIIDNRPGISCYDPQLVIEYANANSWRGDHGRRITWWD